MIVGNINEFIEVRFALENQKHGNITGSNSIGVVELFEKSVKKVSRINSPAISEFNEKSVEFQVGDIIEEIYSGSNYKISDVVVEYHASGIHHKGQPNILIRVYLISL